MGFGEAVGLFFKNYTNFQGRSRRAEYWWAYLMYMLAYLAFVVVVMVAGSLGAVGQLLAGIVGIAFLLFSLAIIIPMFAVSFRRMHDLDKSAWWLLISLIPIVSLILLWWFCQPGTSGPNTYGPDPKGGVNVGAFD